MDENKLNDIPDWDDNLNSINKKLEAAANPFKRITDIASRVNQNMGMFDLASQYKEVGTRINKHSNMYDQLFAPSLNVYKMSDAIMHMNDKSNALQIALGGSTISKLAKFAQESRPYSDNRLADIANGIHDKFRAYSGVYQRQQSITEVLSKGYFTANHLTNPAWLKKITQTERRFDTNNHYCPTVKIIKLL